MANDAKKSTTQVTDELPPGTTIPELLVHLARTVRAVRLLDINDYERANAEKIRGSLLPDVQRLVRFAAQLFERMFEHYQDESAGGETAGKPDDRAKVADLCFIGKMELVGALQRIREPLDDVDRSSLLTRAIHCRGTIVNVAMSVDEAVCRAEGWKTTLDSAPELRESMIVRSAYASLFELIEHIPKPESDGLFRSLSAARDAIGCLLVPPIRGLIRFSDRESLEQVRGKVDVWLAGPGPGDERTGNLLWQEINLLTRSLMQVNNRQELVSHDLDVARKLLERLNSPPAADGWVLDGEFLTSLRSLRGRERALDRIIDYLESSVLKELKAVLWSMSDRLAHEGEDAAPSQTTNEERTAQLEAALVGASASSGPAAASSVTAPPPATPLAAASRPAAAVASTAAASTPASASPAAQGPGDLAAVTPQAARGQGASQAQPAGPGSGGPAEVSARKPDPMKPSRKEQEELGSQLPFELDFDATIPKDD